MKSKLLPVLLVILILLNGVLIFMLIKKPHEKQQVSQRSFITQELNFSDEQIAQFKSLDQFHKETMNGLDKQLRKQKDLLFSSFSEPSQNIDSLSQITGVLEAKKDIEVFNFFSSVRKICTKEQQDKFDIIIKKALKGDKKGPPRKEGEHPPREGRVPPPR
jgi:hypothetical protein